MNDREKNQRHILFLQCQGVHFAIETLLIYVSTYITRIRLSLLSQSKSKTHLIA